MKPNRAVHKVWASYRRGGGCTEAEGAKHEFCTSNSAKLKCGKNARAQCKTRTVCDRKKKSSRVEVEGKKNKKVPCRCLVTLDCGVVGGGEEMVGVEVVEPSTKKRG